MKPTLVLLASLGFAAAYVDCRVPNNQELSNTCTTDSQFAGCRSQCKKHCGNTGANTAICVNKANNDFDCVCAQQAGRPPGFP
ncbi:hypothetical protein CPLU01_15658 [Colletotrichum plurivorum]|uniref:Uncharacterized protein n=1 Tax=Colletotrichum plurivorum TaxID=2175906 RepID=A0A8H6J9M0_9PEZI|nr:hypothetical protein CPLU01_15658 [Colletotrichum plurivorum]